MKIAVSIEPRDAVTLHAWAEAALRLPDITDLQRATVREALRRFNTAFNEAARPLAVASLTHPDAQVGGTCPHGDRNGGLFCAHCIEDDCRTFEAAKVWDGRGLAASRARHLDLTDG
jgi:hypothetical protein